MVKILAQVLVFLTIINVYGQSTKLDSLENKLVELALSTYPGMKVNALRVKSAHKDIGLARSAWGEQVIGQYNLNEANLNPASTNGINIFYPRYLFGLRLTLGTFMKIPLQTQKAKVEHKIAETELEQQKLLLISEVKRRFRIYVARKENLILRKQLTDEAKSQLNIAVKKYNNKEITFEEYLRVSNSYLSLKETLNLTESEMYVAKYSLEELIGMDISLLE